jgi:hypothetical protein
VVVEPDFDAAGCDFVVGDEAGAALRGFAELPSEPSRFAGTPRSTGARSVLESELRSVLFAFVCRGADGFIDSERTVPNGDEPASLFPVAGIPPTSAGEGLGAFPGTGSRSIPAMTETPPLRSLL